MRITKNTNIAIDSTKPNRYLILLVSIFMLFCLSDKALAVDDFKLQAERMKKSYCNRILEAMAENLKRGELYRAISLNDNKAYDFLLLPGAKEYPTLQNVFIFENGILIKNDEIFQFDEWRSPAFMMFNGKVLSMFFNGEDDPKLQWH